MRKNVARLPKDKNEEKIKKKILKVEGWVSDSCMGSIIRRGANIVGAILKVEKQTTTSQTA